MCGICRIRNECSPVYRYTHGVPCRRSCGAGNRSAADQMQGAVPACRYTDNDSPVFRQPENTERHAECIPVRKENHLYTAGGSAW